MSIVPAMWDSMSTWLTPTVLFLFLNFMIATIFVTSGFGSSQQNPHQAAPQKQEFHFEQQPQQQQLYRSPSVLQRLKSINLYQYTNYYRSHDPVVVPTQLNNSSSSSSALSYIYNDDETTPLQPREEEEQVVVAYPDIANDDDVIVSEDDDDQYEDSEGFDKSLEEVYRQLQQGGAHQHFRTKSDTEPASGAVPVKLVRKMKKSASSKSAFGHFREEEIAVGEEVKRPATVREGKSSSGGGEDAEVDAKADDFINRFKNQLKLQRLDSILRYKEMLGRGAATINK